MNERTLRKRLNWMTVVVVLISILIIAGGSFASASLRGILQNALARQIESNAEQYKINIKRKIDGDFQTLNTLTSFLRFGKMDTGSFINGLMASKEYTEFDSMGYFGTAGTGLLVNTDTRVERELPLFPGFMILRIFRKTCSPMRFRCTQGIRWLELLLRK